MNVLDFLDETRTLGCKVADLLMHNNANLDNIKGYLFQMKAHSKAYSER